jgi:hypothetical protein
VTGRRRRRRRRREEDEEETQRLSSACSQHPPARTNSALPGSRAQGRRRSTVPCIAPGDITKSYALVIVSPIMYAALMYQHINTMHIGVCGRGVVVCVRESWCHGV